VKTARETGLDAVIVAALAPWRKPRAVHDPGKVPMDVALAVASVATAAETRSVNIDPDLARLRQAPSVTPTAG
jgi:tRNA1(Val) A37 N6-methylase TrmN6